MNDRTRNTILIILIALVPALFLANVWQSYRYVRLDRSLSQIQREHLALIEENKRLIVGIAGLRSPDRIREIAGEDLGLSPLRADQVRRIDLGGARGD